MIALTGADRLAYLLTRRDVVQRMRDDEAHLEELAMRAVDYHGANRRGYDTALDAIDSELAELRARGEVGR